MPTIVIRIDAEEANGYGYPVRLLVEGTEVANGLIPSDLAAGPQAWTAAEIEQVMTQGRSDANLRKLGSYLFALLEAGGVTTKWLTTRKGVADGLLRTIFDIEPRNLQMLPWEVLFAAPGHVALQSGQPSYRSVPSNFAHAYGVELPLRILVIVGAADQDVAIGWREEVQALRLLFRRNPEAIDLEVTVRPERKNLVGLYRMFRPHIVHFIGHCGLSAAGDFALKFSDGKNPRSWTVTQIVQDLGTNAWRPRMVFLNACRTADPRGQDSSHDIARAVVTDAGACCAIGMQADVPGKAAAVFAEAVYTKIIAGRTVDEAVTEARIEAEQASDIWPLPVLQIACMPEVALPARFAAGTDVDNVRTRFREPLACFADRQNERRQFWSDVAVAGPAKRLIVIHGGQLLGKTALILWCVRHFALRGERVRYVSLKTARKDYRGFLELLRNGDETGWPVTGRLPDAPFERFDARFADQVPSSENFVAELFDLICEGLKTLAEDKPLLLVIDQIDFVDDAPFTAAFTTYIKPFFVDRARNGSAGNVKLVLVMKEREYASDEMADVRVHAHPVELFPWDRKDFRAVAEEVFAEVRAKDPEFADKLIDLAEISLKNPTWTPLTLAPYIELARTAGFIDV